MSHKTLFEKIADKEIPASIEFEDNECIVIKDINPQAPVHLLIIPKKVIPRLAHANTNDKDILGHLLLVAKEMAHALNLDNGFRIIINNGPSAGETVPHLHIHLMGGRSFSWPAG